VIEMDAASDLPPIGERVRIIPNHACVVSNLFDIVHLVGPNGEVEALPVDARGRSD
jgi:D-serine deaminase-like pyridoxal phosphate-dependent protein